MNIQHCAECDVSVYYHICGYESIECEHPDKPEGLYLGGDGWGQGIPNWCPKIENNLEEMM